MNKQRLVMVIVAAAGVVATFLPWAGAMGFTVNGLGLQGSAFFGYANLVLFAVAAVLCLLGDRSERLAGGMRTLACICAIAGGAMALIISFKAFHGGMGTWLAILAAIAFPIVAAKVK